MSRTFPSNIQAILDSGNIEYFTLLALYFSTTYRRCSLNRTVVYNGNSYAGSDLVVELDPPRRSNVVDREAYRITLADPGGELQAEIRNGVVQKSVEILVGLIDPTTGQPLTGIDEVFYVYKGYIDSPQIVSNFEERLAIFECTSPMADLDAAKPFYTSKAGMDQFSSTDTSFDRIHENSELYLKWGKI